MKTLGRININSGKLMKNEELLKLRGGYDGGGCETDCHSHDENCTDTKCPKCRDTILNGWRCQAN
jgi:hypothetical protein